MNKLNIGLIGAGRVAQAHAQACLNLADRVKVVAVADTDPGKARETADRCGAGQAMTDYRRLLELPEVDAVIVSLPHHLHLPVGLECARAGKHLLLEKPMALTAADGRRLVEAADRAGVTFMVGQSRRFSDAVRTLWERRDELGEVWRIVTNFLVFFPEPPTAWWNEKSEAGELIIQLQGSHSLDFIGWFLGRQPEKVFATAHSRNPKCAGSDEADILTMFADGATGSVHLSLNTRPPVHETLVIGTQGSARLVEWGTGAPFEFGLALDLNGKRLVEGVQQPSCYTHQLAEFAAALAEGREPVASGREVLRTVRMTQAAVESAASGTVVTL